MQKLIEAGEVSEGLIAAEGYDDEIVDGMLNPHDDLNILVTLKASGSVEKTVIGSLAAALKLDPASTDFTTLRNIFIQPSLQLASFTITEKGYRVRDEKRGRFCRRSPLSLNGAAGGAQPYRQGCCVAFRTVSKRGAADRAGQYG